MMWWIILCLQLEEKHGSGGIKLNAENDLINADEVHFSNLINNLIDNAMKYSKENQPPIYKDHYVNQVQRN